MIALLKIPTKVTFRRPAIPAQLSDSQIRRNLGRYDTPRPLSQAVADWAIRKRSDEALEPSSGSGVFVLSLAHRLRDLGNKNPNQQLWACDIDPAACAQTKQASGLLHNHVWNDDFLALVSINGAHDRKFDCVVGNPPYISLHRMLKDQRERAKAAADRLKLNIDRTASLWAYFLAATTHTLRPGGRVAFILPESLLHAEYAVRIVRHFASSFVECTLVSIRERCFVSNGAAERVVLVLANGFRRESGPTEIALHECVTAENAVSFLTRLSNGEMPSLPTLNGHAVPHLLPATVEPALRLSAAPGSHSFGEFADIKIGVVTGADDFFVISEPERKKLKLRRAWLIPLLPRFQECKGLTYKSTDWQKLRDRGEKCWLLSPQEKTSSVALGRYLATFPAERKKVNRTFTKRRLWFAPTLGRKPHAFLRYMGATGPRLAFARFDLSCTNIIHRVFFRPQVSPLERKAILLSLHSSYSQVQAEFKGRSYGSGVLKLEPSEGRRLHLLLPAKLDRIEIDRCFEAVDNQLRKGNPTAATALVDDWLYQSISGLGTMIPRQHLTALLKLSVHRRLGYPHFNPLEDRKICLTNFATEMLSVPSNPSRIRNVALTTAPRRSAPPQAKSDQTPYC
jgi:adenine-specific DNA-methyltransferase